MRHVSQPCDRERRSRPAWRKLIEHARASAEAALDPETPLDGIRAPDCVFHLRHDLKGTALTRFPVPGVSAEQARLAFVFQARGVLDAGLPETRARLARGLAVLTDELEGLLVDQVARETEQSLRRAGRDD